MDRVKLVCPRCGIASAPVAERCSCGRALQDAASAGARRREWEALEPALRADLDRTFAESARRYAEYAASLRRYRWLHALIGAVVLTAASANAGAREWILGAALGGAAGLVLNLTGGGRLLGGLVFFASFAAVILASWGLRFEGYATQQAVLLSVAILMFVTVIGAYFGMRLDWRHSGQALEDDSLR